MASEPLCRDLRTVVSAVNILDGSRFRIDGYKHKVDDSTAAPWIGDTPAPSSLAAALAQSLYHRLYCRPGPATVRPHDPLGLRRHLARLSAANTGHGTWESGWLCHTADDDAAIAERQGVLFRVPGVLLRGGAGGPRRGERCRVRIPEESQWLLPGFYLARGDAEGAPDDAGDALLRFYWHLRAAGAAAWIRTLTARLNQRQIPFSLKALVDPRDYRRADAGVLYLEGADYAAARENIVHGWREVRRQLRPEVPLCTAWLAPGLGVAEGSPDRESFGQQRCQVIAAALAGAFEENRISLAEQSAAVAAGFRAAGLDPRQPHLAPGSTASYRPWSERELTPSERRRPGRPLSFGEAARRIADTLCREAFWHDGRCNWVGCHRYPGFTDREDGGARVAALPADIYQGGAGVGLFLAELYVVTGEATYRETALGALRQALAARSETPHFRQLSFYCGRLGVAWAADRVAKLTGEEALASETRVVLAELLATPGEEHLLDVISGNAGAIPALLELHRSTGEARCLSTAVALGEEIVDAGRRAGEIWSWSNERVAGSGAEDPPLTGLAHGAAGLGLALYELFAAAGGRPFLTAARGAFAYEDALFDRRHRNWPDLCDVGDAEAAPKFKVAWCHGAPGIVLSRLRALSIDSDRASAYEAAARAGLETVLHTLDELATADCADTSLCHGLCGLIEIAMVGSRILGEEAPRETAESALERLVEDHATRNDWPSGVLSPGRNPSLLLGEAGVGLALLRLAHPGRTPTVLLPGNGEST